MKISIADQINAIEEIYVGYFNCAAEEYVVVIEAVLETLRSVERMGTVEELFKGIMASKTIPVIYNFDDEEEEE